MLLVCDWYMARVYDSEGQCLDESTWGGNKSIHAISNRLSLLSKGRMTPEAKTLAERFPNAEHRSPNECNFEWPKIASSLQIQLQEATIRLAESGVAAAVHNPDHRLEHLVRGMDEIRSSHNALESQIVEWVGLFLPRLDLDKYRHEIVAATANATNFSDVGKNLDSELTDVEVGSAEWASIKGCAETTMSQFDCLSDLESAVKELAQKHLPTLSKLLGPLLAARLCVTAHGRPRLARLPAGTIQVLGAEKAFFMHLRQGTDPPKHGHIFQHPWICRSPKWIRGKVSRMLASKAAIAARIDHFEGKPWSNQDIEEIENIVKDIRNRYPNPSSVRR